MPRKHNDRFGFMPGVGKKESKEGAIPNHTKFTITVTQAWLVHHNLVVCKNCELTPAIHPLPSCPGYVQKIKGL